MKVIVGLGNPGKDYSRTKHNVGFWVVDELCKRWGVSCTSQKWKALIGEHRIGTEKIILCKPQTYMNLSGESVREVVEYHSNISVQSDVIVVYDDMDFPAGQVKLRQKGSAGGHNGVKSVIQHLGTQEFCRVRVGIGRPEEKEQVIAYVLSGFPPAQQKEVETAVKIAADAIEFALQNSFTLAMNRFNEATK
jgi:PTH1 family peptidyl-tRNA hydrolase